MKSINNINNIVKSYYKIDHFQKREILSHFYKYLSTPPLQEVPDYSQSIEFKENNFSKKLSIKLFNGETPPYDLELFNEKIQIGPAKEYLSIIEDKEKKLGWCRLIENIFTNHPKRVPFIFTHFQKFNPSKAPIYDHVDLEENSLLLGTFLLSTLSNVVNGPLTEKFHLKKDKFDVISDKLFSKLISKEEVEKIVKENELNNIIRTSCTGTYLHYATIFGNMQEIGRRPNLEKAIYEIVPYNHFEISQPQKIIKQPMADKVKNTNITKLGSDISSSIYKI